MHNVFELGHWETKGQLKSKPSRPDITTMVQSLSIGVNTFSISTNLSTPLFKHTHTVEPSEPQDSSPVPDLRLLRDLA